MACHHKNSHHKLDLEDSSKKLVLAGNPNVGKSIFFNYLTGIYVAVSNYPGTTLDITKGRYQDFTVLDTPGVYGVSSFNDEEIVARDVIMAADIVVNVVDAVHLERDLFLTQQIIDMGIPVIIALNMMDEAEKNGLSINIDRLSSELGVPVIPTTAVSGRGLSELKASLNRARVGESIFEKHNGLTEKLAKMNEETASTRDALLILEGDPHLADRYRLKPMNFREEIYRIRRKRVDQIIDNVVSDLNDGKGVKATLSRMMVNPVTGVPLLLITLYILYQLIGVFIAQTVVSLTEEAFFLEIYEPFIRNLVSRVIPAASFTSKLLIGEFGILTMAVTYVFGLLLPLVIGFYFFLSILEDSGYMPRIAALVDRTLTSLGLNGRAIIPMLLGFGCVTMATITTRLLGSKRERIIAIFLLGLAIPCSAQLGVIVGLISPLGLKYFMIYVFVLVLVYVLSGTFLNKVLPGKSTDLLIDLPPLRIPRFGNVLNKTRIKSFAFIKEAGPIFVLGAVIITVLQETGILIYIQELVAPITIGWLRLPPEVATAFVMGIIRRDFGAAGLNSLAMTPSQTTVALITITLFVPCIAAMMIMVKERNWKEATAIWFGSWFTAFIVGGLVALFI